MISGRNRRGRGQNNERGGGERGEREEEDVDLERNIYITPHMQKCRENATLIKHISIIDLLLSASLGAINHYFLITLPLFLLGYFGSKRYNKKYITGFLIYYTIINFIRCQYYLKTIIDTPIGFRSKHIFTVYFNFLVFSCVILFIVNGKIYKFHRQLKRLTALQLDHLRTS